MPSALRPLIPISRDTSLDRSAILTAPLAIRASHITVDGNGATIVGPGEPGRRDSYQGVGILAEGCSGVTLRNFKVRGFKVGLQISDASGWVIEDCDFSDNYTDPSAGWDVPGRFGGIILTRVCRGVLRRNLAQRVWNGLDLRECHENVIADNAFSHCSNIALKLWTSCRNLVADNDLSYGLRIDPGEAHARDSAGILIESGSDDNTFAGNDVTHGGDGIFIRVLNGWVSRRNLFIENDCSYANNNGFEAWSPDNTYIRNKANHCSYGFWLGASDHTVLLGNEAAWNGQPDGFHNAPEKLFGHGGIVFVGGSSTHTRVAGNHCHHNNGAGIVLRGHAETQGNKWRASHWIIQNNRLESNRWGIHAQHADLLCLAANSHKDNEQDDFLDNVTRLLTLPLVPRLACPAVSGLSSDPGEEASPSTVGQAARGTGNPGPVPRLAGPAVPSEEPRPDKPTGAPVPVARLEGPSWARVGERVAFDAAQSRDPAGLPLHFLWDVAMANPALPRVSTPREATCSPPALPRVLDPREVTASRIEHVFEQPGFYRVALTVHNGHLADMAWRDLYVVREGNELGTEGSAEGWSFRMPNVERTARVDPSHARQQVVLDPSHARQQVVFDPSHARKQVVFDPSHARKQVVFDPSHARQQVVLDPSHTRQQVVFDPSHARQQVVLDPSHARKQVVAVTSEALVGRFALEARVDPYPGGPVELLFQFPVAERPASLGGKTALTFWLKRRCEHYRSFDGPNPVVTLYGQHGGVAYTPQGNTNLIDSWENPSESRWGWLLFTIPFAGSEVWMRQREGEAPAEPLDAVEAIGFQFQACGDEPFTIWLDGLALE